MDSSMSSSTPDPEMWIIQGTLAWRTSPIQCRSNFLFTHGICEVWGDHHGTSLFDNPCIPYQCMDSYLLSIGLGST
ncbi:hypothetical protein V6Z11_D01G165400 [Gossypium hirsutum]